MKVVMYVLGWRLTGGRAVLCHLGTHFTYALTCDNVRVQSSTEWTASVQTLHMPKPAEASNTLLSLKRVVFEIWGQAVFHPSNSYLDVVKCQACVFSMFLTCLC